jgi:iron complex outermembrane receptor protein
VILRQYRPIIATVTALTAFLAWAPIFAQTSHFLADLSLEELGSIEVTSVSKQAESLLDAPASVFVISREDIVRSGVTSIPEALRLAPGVEVARRGSHAWSVSIRGFNSDLANKLLVLIDGRSVYSPLYAGVFWDVQDTLLDDIDRIEVVSGPGGTLWGANAVNGVINIITRPAKESLGGFATLGAGNEERGFAGLRVGGELGTTATARAYLKYFDRDASLRVGGSDAPDDWRMARGGFRLDWQPSSLDQMRLQGDIYDGQKAGEFLDEFTLGTLPQGVIRDDVQLSGGNLMVEWQRELASSSSLRLQAYYDRTNRDIPNTYKAERDTFDVDAQHAFSPGTRHALLWGAGVRLTRDTLGNTLFATFDPDSRTDRTYSLFVQDKITLSTDKVFLTLGSKFEENDYTGFEWQPGARLSWLIDERRTTWVAVSRAVRIPSRLDADLRLTAPFSVPEIPFPIYITINGSNDFESEELLAYEAGYRWQVNDRVYFDLAAFYNDYDQLQTTEPDNPELVLPFYIVLPNTLGNNMHGTSHGGTLAVNWQPALEWQLRFHYAYYDLQLQTNAASLDPNAPGIAGNSPRHQLSLFSFLDFLDVFNLYAAIRYVDDLPNQNVADYTALDISLRWKLTDSFDISLTGQNLTDSSHAEFGPAAIETERSIYVKAAWTM